MHYKPLTKPLSHRNLLTGQSTKQAFIELLNARARLDNNKPPKAARARDFRSGLLGTYNAIRIKLWAGNRWKTLIRRHIN